MNPKRNLKGVSRLGLLAVILMTSLALATPEQVPEQNKAGGDKLDIKEGQPGAQSFSHGSSDEEVDAWFQVWGAAVGRMPTPTPTSPRPTPTPTSPSLTQTSSPPPPGSPVARNFVWVIDRDDSFVPTPINTAYCNAINATGEGDEIFAFQKYFRNERINDALIAAAGRKVQVTGIYRDALDPSCSSLPPSERTLCDGIFVQSSLPHHKNMMILHSDGTVRAVIGSYNPRERTLSEPRIHTVLTFDIVNGGSVFDYYRGEADRLLGLPTTQPLAMSVDVEGGGTLQLQMHPADAHPVLDMLNAVTTFESTLWMSFYGASNDTIGTPPVYDRLQALNDAGCDVRVLLHAHNYNSGARSALEARGVPVQFPTYPVGTGVLGHKLLMVRSGGDLHLIQSSANLNESHDNTSLHNLTLYLRAPGLNTIQTELEAELNRYWR